MLPFRHFYMHQLDDYVQTDWKTGTACKLLAFYTLCSASSFRVIKFIKLIYEVLLVPYV